MSPAIVEAKDDQAKLRQQFGLAQKTLSAVLSEHAGDFKLARLNQTDMDADGLERVVRRSEMFQTCMMNSSRGSCLLDSNSKCTTD
jgi:hypothetical protein